MCPVGELQEISTECKESIIPGPCAGLVGQEMNDCWYDIGLSFFLGQAKKV